MTNQHPITPPPELVKKLQEKAPYFEGVFEREQCIINAAYQAGADQELEACCAEMDGWGDIHYSSGWKFSKDLRDRRRPKPPTLKEQALAIGPEWQPCVKLPITVHVREQRHGETHISTREGLTPLLPDDLIMRGVQGEEYPIGRELFEQTYRMGTNESEGPTDNELRELWHDGWDTTEEFGAFQFARAVLARWGQS